MQEPIKKKESYKPCFRDKKKINVVRGLIDIRRQALQGNPRFLKGSKLAKAYAGKRPGTQPVVAFAPEVPRSQYCFLLRVAPAFSGMDARALRRFCAWK